MDVGGEPVVARNGPHAGRFHEQVLDVAYSGVARQEVDNDRMIDQQFAINSVRNVPSESWIRL